MLHFIFALLSAGFMSLPGHTHEYCHSCRSLALCRIVTIKSLTSSSPASVFNLCGNCDTPIHLHSSNMSTVFGGKGRSGVKRKPGVSRSARAGLQFPVGRISRFLRRGRYGQRLGGGAPVYLAGVLEYLAAEVLELAGNAARDNRKSRITPRHITLAVRGDEELSELWGNATISSGGVIPNIHRVLLPKSKKQKNKEKQERLNKFAEKAIAKALKNAKKKEEGEISEEAEEPSAEERQEEDEKNKDDEENDNESEQNKSESDSEEAPEEGENRDESEN